MYFFQLKEVMPNGTDKTNGNYFQLILEKETKEEAILEVLKIIHAMLNACPEKRFIGSYCMCEKETSGDVLSRSENFKINWEKRENCIYFGFMPLEEVLKNSCVKDTEVLVKERMLLFSKEGEGQDIPYGEAVYDVEENQLYSEDGDEVFGPDDKVFAYRTEFVTDGEFNKVVTVWMA